MTRRKDSKGNLANELSLGATQFTFHATLLATISVTADTRAHFDLKLRTAIEGANAKLGMLDGKPIAVPVAIEGDLDLIEATRPQHGSRRRPALAKERR